MSEAVQTLDGWYALHDFRLIDWDAWKRASVDERLKALREMGAFLQEWRTAEAEKTGSTAFYSVVGQKADFVLMHLRETPEELNELETTLNKSSFAQFLIPAYSYVSIIELSSYLAKPGTDPYQDPELVARLKPILPQTKHICFYPMNKKREGNDNWYMLPLADRGRLMRTHGETGRKYAGKVKQIVTGSVGMDEWEWGVTLFSDDMLQFKKLVYEMRFDEVSARYGEFGDFFVGNLLGMDKLTKMLEVK